MKHISVILLTLTLCSCTGHLNEDYSDDLAMQNNHSSWNDLFKDVKEKNINNVGLNNTIDTINKGNN